MNGLVFTVFFLNPDRQLVDSGLAGFRRALDLVAMVKLTASRQCLATSTRRFSITSLLWEQDRMKYQNEFKHALASAFVCFTFLGCVQTCDAQLTPGFTVTASDDAEFLGRTLFPDSAGNPFRFDSAFLDFGLEGLPYDYEGGFEGGSTPSIPVASLPTIGTFINNSAVYGIGDPGNTVATGIAISSGLVENYGGGANFSGSSTGFFGDGGFDPETEEFIGVSGPTASEAQTTLLNEISPAAFGVFRDTTSLSINFTNVTQGDQVLDLFAVFGTEETPDFVNSGFNDAFGVFLNGENIALQSDLPLNVDHPNHLPVLGTELDTVITSPDGPNGVTVPYIDLTTTVGVGQHELTIVLGDASDDALDSTAYLSRDVTDQPVTGVALLPTTINQDGDFLFEDVTVAAGEPLFIDPDIAIGYEYSVEELAGATEALFDSVRVDPAGSDIAFTINYLDQNGNEFFESLTAGVVFEFPDAAEVLSFRILDIDPLENLPADNPLAFATLLTFRNDLNNATVIQAPISISAVPEPGSAILLLVGISTALLRRRRRVLDA